MVLIYDVHAQLSTNAHAPPAGSLKHMCVITWLAVLQLPRCPVLPAHRWPAGLGQGRAAAEHRQLLSAEGWLRLWLPCSPAGPASHELAGLSLLQQLQGCISILVFQCKRHAIRL